MKFEYLIGIIIFLVYVVSMVLKRAHAGSKTGREEILPSEDQEPESIRQRISPAPTIKPAPAKAVVESMKPTVSKKENLPKDSVYPTFTT